MTNRNKSLQFAYTLAIGVVFLLSANRAFATNEENHIQEVMAGVNGNSKIQFIVIKQEGGGNLWGPQAGETQSRVMLVFFDAAGREIGKFKFPHNVPADANPQLIATQDFANLPGAPTPDFIMPPLLNPIGGKVCFTNNPLNPNAAIRTDCVSYGSFPPAQTGTDSGGCNGTVAAGSPTVALPIVNTVSLTRTSTLCGSVPNGDFVINATPTPVNDAGQTLTIPLATQVAQGENLFNGETFQGNGRTCATCHVASLNLALPPSNIQSRFSTVSTTFDPLFIGETAPSGFDAGFDFNLNTLELTQEVPSGTPCPGTLQGIITSGSGATGARAKVLTQVSPTTYLVYGGMNPALSSTVSDSNSCSGTVLSITAGSLGAISGSTVLGLENPKRMRTSADTANFPQGRGLILENIDGFAPTPNVFRKSPHLLNLSQRFSPFGLSGNFFDLQTFATGAVTQHFPRTLARNSGGTDPDFRLPTPDELVAMEAFMRSLDFPAGTDPNKFNLNNFVVTAAQRRGLNAFTSVCSVCHGSTILNSSATFNTGVVNQTINSAGVDNLPCEPVSPCGSRAFSVRQLFNIANLGPFFHDGSAATLKDVLAFYNSSTFANSPGSTGFSGPINTSAISPTATDDIIAFLEGISFSPFVPTFGPTGTVVTISGTNFTGATAVSFNGVAATFTEGPPGTITTTVPAGATTGRITVTTLGGPIVTTTRFTVTPVLTSFAPASGAGGTGVTITGTSFTGATAVSFNGAPAAFTVSNSGTVTTTVPAGATNGPITVTTLDGAATSAASFTVTLGGPPFSLVATPSSQTVSAGAATSYFVLISRTAGFSDFLTFSVSGLPAATTASFIPNPTNATSSTINVTTTSRAQLLPGPTLQLPPANFSVRAWPLWAICLLVMVLLAYRHRATRHIPRWVFATGGFAVLLFIGCGGGGSAPPPPPPPHGTPAGTFTITVTATSSNASVQPISMPVTLIVK